MLMANDDAFIAACQQATSERNAVLARVAAQPFPYLKDTWGGFEVRLEAPAGERRFVEIILDDDLFSCRLYDTVACGTRDVDRAVACAAVVSNWMDLNLLLEEWGGVTLEARHRAVPLTAVLRNSTLILKEPNSRESSLLGFGRAEFSFTASSDGVIFAKLYPSDPPLYDRFVQQYFWDWIEVEPFLAKVGVTFKPTPLTAARQ
jgi:hypothetical protein